ncbi:MAG: RpiB/LacA/LacB family sugar-phosphate isomerase [Christensenellales bacterium]|jgi:ribose 5-phosphate isomerase RpiB
MRIGLIVEESQAFRVEAIEKALVKAAQQYGHEVYNFTNDYASYDRTALLCAVLLNAGAVDFVVTGCGTGMGAIISANAFPNVQCGFVAEPVDATMFREINMGNAIAMPFSKRYGNEGDLNLDYCFDKLLCPLQTPYYIGAKARETCEGYKRDWDALKSKTHKDMLQIVQSLDREFLKTTLDSDVFRAQFFSHCRDAALGAYIQEVLG